MEQIAEANSIDARGRLRRVQPKESGQEQPDETWMSEVSGRATGSIWWRRIPHLPGEKLALLGHYEANNDEAAALLLAKLEERARQQGATFLVGPINGSTWRSYRFVTEDSSEPPFFLEPNHPSSWLGQWRQAGFETLAKYGSAITPQDWKGSWRELDELDRLQRDQGYTLRSLHTDRWTDELRLLHDLSLRSFASNFLYSPMSWEQFAADSERLRPYIVPALVLIAEKAGQPIGFVFAMPDALVSTRSIIKTVAVLPDHRRKGLASWLVGQAEKSAFRNGFSRVIHALMHECNASMRISASRATVFRRYELLGKKLAVANSTGNT